MWPIESDAKLRENWGKVGKDELAFMFGLKYDTIRRHAIEIGIAERLIIRETNKPKEPLKKTDSPKVKLMKIVEASKKRLPPMNFKSEIEKAKPKTKHWSKEEIENLYNMTERRADPKELLYNFPDQNLRQIVAMADRNKMDTCYLKDREVLMKSIDIKLKVNLDLDLILQRLNVVCAA